MQELKKSVSLIYERARRTLAISRDEYALCDYALYRSADPRQRIPGWCCDTKDAVADFVGITRPGLYKMMAKMQVRDLLEIEASTGFFRATERLKAHFPDSQYFETFPPLEIKVEAKRKDTFVYLVLDFERGYYKIGKANNPLERFKQIKTSNSSVRLICSYPGHHSDEQTLHEIFSPLRVSGEWFDLAEHDRAVFHHYFAQKGLLPTIYN